MMKSERHHKMTKVFYVLYCTTAEAYVYEEREDCWQFSSQEFATEFESEEEAKNVKAELEAAGFPSLTIFKMQQITKIVEEL